MALVDAIRAEASGVAVDHGFPGDQWQHEHIWIADVTGDVTYPVVAANQWIRDDRFVIAVAIVAAQPGQEPAAQLARTETLLFYVEAAVHNQQAAIEGLVDDGGLFSLEMGTVEGPTVELGGEGWVGAAVAQVQCHGRTSGVRYQAG